MVGVTRHRLSKLSASESSHTRRNRSAVLVQKGPETLEPAVSLNIHPCCYNTLDRVQAELTDESIWRLRRIPDPKRTQKTTMDSCP
jgi:hypothetical protein